MLKTCQVKAINMFYIVLYDLYRHDVIYHLIWRLVFSKDSDISLNIHYKSLLTFVPPMSDI